MRGISRPRASVRPPSVSATLILRSRAGSGIQSALVTSPLCPHTSCSCSNPARRASLPAWGEPQTDHQRLQDLRVDGGLVLDRQGSKCARNGSWGATVREGPRRCRARKPVAGVRTVLSLSPRGPKTLAFEAARGQSIQARKREGRAHPENVRLNWLPSRTGHGTEPASKWRVDEEERTPRNG